MFKVSLIIIVTTQSKEWDATFSLD